MLDTLWTIRWATRDYFSIIGAVLKGGRGHWEPVGGGVVLRVTPA